MNFPDCCDFRGKDVCGFACPKCPIKLDKYGRRKKPKTTPKPSLRNQLQSKEPFSRLFSIFKKYVYLCTEGSSGNPTSNSACGKNDLNIDALLLDPIVRGQIIAKLMKLKQIFQPSFVARETTTTSTTTAKPSSPNPPSNPLAALPTDLLENPQIKEFIKNNPEIIKKIAAEGLPSPDKLEALLSLAAPPPEGVEQGLFGPDVFAGEEFDVQGFGDYEYDEEYDYGDDDDDEAPTIEDYPEYGDFEGNANEVRVGRSRQDLNSQATLLKFKYRLVSKPKIPKKSYS